MDRLERLRLDRERLEGRLVLIVDLEDEPLFTHSLRTALEDAGAVSWVVHNESDALAQAEKEGPDLVIIDLEFPHSRVLAVGKAIHSKSPQSVVLTLGSFYDSRFALEIMRNGFRGYLTKDISFAEFVSSIGIALTGDVVLAPKASRRPHNLLTPDQLEALQRAEQLTHREQEVLALLSKGADGRQIEGALLISRNTVRRHIQNVLTKLQVHSRLEAATFSTRFGIEIAPRSNNGSC